MELSFQKQTKLHNPEKGIFGNCMVTCYANYLNIPVENCPAFEELFSCKYPEELAEDVWASNFDRSEEDKFWFGSLRSGLVEWINAYCGRS